MTIATLTRIPFHWVHGRAPRPAPRGAGRIHQCQYWLVAAFLTGPGS
jgi:hypothetical protein